ncbi:hypothetical protein Q2T40_06175 [Winogradskyella maritima]|uniref:Calx-beta domain-containing protein n=1 Tax=Winogradskyella maritima TaxID=1517766 RepID=A0ABV8AM34_9FLAO|nr:hypothetical protein [Winogradskyella maritima]
MKNILKLTFISVLVLLVGCDEYENPTYNGVDFVQLEDGSAEAIIENSGDVVEIDVLLSSPQASETTINFETTGDPSRYALTPSSGTLTIPAGMTSATLSFEAIDNDDIDGDLDVEISLSTSSGLPVGIGGEGVQNTSKVITIVDDNVPCNDYVVSVTTDRWGSENSWEITDSSGMVVASDGPYSDGPSGFTETYVTNVTLDDGCYTFTMFDSYGDGQGSGSYSVSCGALVAASGSGDLDNNNSSESTDFCVNQ